MAKISVWHQLCASLYTIEDAVCATEYYQEAEYPTDYKGKYLFTYGLFQALVLQQNAISGINNSLFNKPVCFKTDYPELYFIREVRNDIIGHPTERGCEKNKNLRFVRLVQHSMSKNFLEYSVSGTGDNDEWKNINITDLLNNQNKCINDILQKTVDELDKNMLEYINMHRDTKIIRIFDKIQYAREKLLASDDVNTDFRTVHISRIQETISEFKAEIDKRYVSWEETDYKYTINDVEELIDIVENRLIEIDSNVFRIDYFLLEHIFCKMDYLRQAAKDIDDFFENYGTEKDETFDNNITITVVDEGDLLV